MMITKIAIALFLINLALFGGPNAEAEEFIKLGDIKGEATDNDHKVFIKLGDIKGEATDNDHKDWIKLGDIKGEATDNDHKDWIKLGDIKGEATDNDHKDWVFVQVMMYCDLVDMGFSAEEADQIVEFTLGGHAD